MRRHWMLMLVAAAGRRAVCGRGRVCAGRIFDPGRRLSGPPPELRRGQDRRPVPAGLHRPRRARARSRLVAAALGQEPDMEVHPADRRGKFPVSAPASASGSAAPSPIPTPSRSSTRASSRCSSTRTRSSRSASRTATRTSRSRRTPTPCARRCGRSSANNEPAAFDAMLRKAGTGGPLVMHAGDTITLHYYEDARTRRRPHRRRRPDHARHGSIVLRNKRTAAP